jgi:hypothetical protein
MYSTDSIIGMITMEIRWLSSVDGNMRIEGDAGGGDGDYGESSTSGPDGMDLDLGGRDACGSDGDGGEDGSMGLEADSGAVSEVEGGTGDVGATETALKPKPSRLRSVAGRQGRKRGSARRRRAALERRAPEAEYTVRDVADEPSGTSL